MGARWYCESDVAEIRGLLPTYTQVLCYWRLELTIKAKLKLESWNQNIRYGNQAAILIMTSLNINRLFFYPYKPIYKNIVSQKFAVDVQSQTKVKISKTKNSNMATRRPFWK